MSTTSTYAAVPHGNYRFKFPLVCAGTGLSTPPEAEYLGLSMNNAPSEAFYLRVGYVAIAEGCPGDFNCDELLSVQDAFDFLGAWFSNDLLADFNGVNGVPVQDLFDFLAAWFNGCPPQGNE